MNKSMIKRLFVFPLIFALLFMNTSFISYADEDEDTEADISEEETDEPDFTGDIESVIAINTAGELLQLSEKCKTSSFSKNLSVELEKDIDLSGIEEFTGIDSFSGIFDGKGHNISGIRLDTGDGTIGFFGFVEEGAVVKNLTVEADIYSSDSNDYLGILSGVNAGTIKDCTAEGKVTGTGHVGGITALNGGTGIIKGCTNLADISSLTYVGGITGENRGIVENSRNSGGVNADSSWLSLEDDSVTSLTISGIIENFSKTVETGTDIGGIAGYSNGLLKGCTNDGTVGYQHAGKNVGGIAGRTGGIIEESSNLGKVYGKQDVGGIAGQFEPAILMQGENLDAYLQELQSLSTQLANDTSAAGASGVDSLRELSDDAATLGNNINSGLSSASDAITSGIYTDAGSTKQRLEAAASSITSLQKSIAEEAEKAGNSLSDATNEHDNTNPSTNPIPNPISDIDYDSVLNEITSLTNTIDAAGGVILNYDVSGAMGNISAGVDSSAQSTAGAVNDAVSSIQGNVNDLAGELSDNINELANSIESTRVTLTNDINAINNKISDIGSLADEQAENLRRIADGGDIIEDYSAVDSENELASRIISCKNTGYVNGDRNVGGVAGNLAIEGKDPQDEKSKNEDGSKYVTLAVLEDSESNGIIELRKENGGGVVGYSDLGLIRNCNAKDRIISEEGNYVGGVVGYARGTVSDCTSASYIDGNSYIGGICGAGKKVRSCYSMTEINAKSGWTGAIMGDVINDSTDDITIAHRKMMNSIFDNYYSNDMYGGINNVDYGGITTSLDYKTMVEGPKGDSFNNIRVYFYDTDYNLIKTSKVKYGDDLNTIEYPELNMGEDVYLIWKGLYSTTAVGNTFLIADEADNVTVLASDLTRNGKPVALISGMFFENTLLHAEEESSETFSVDDKTIETGFTYNISLLNEPYTENKEYKVRLYSGDMTDPAVYQKTEGRWEPVSYKNTGSYVEVELSDNSAEYALADMEETGNTLYFIIGGAVILAVLVVVVLFSVLKKKRGKVPAADQK